MLQSFIPFRTALMGEYATDALAVSLFGVVIAVNTLLFIALHAYILRHLIKPELVDAQEPHIIQKSFVGVLSYLIGAGGAWFSVPVAFVVYLLTPALFYRPSYKARRCLTRLPTCQVCEGEATSES
jgi:TMEM175 potassium channel family protein